MLLAADARESQRAGGWNSDGGNGVTGTTRAPPGRSLPAAPTPRRATGMHLERLMKKLKLQIDELRVETFAVAAQAAKERGTIQAHGAEAPTMPLDVCFRSVFPTCGIYC
jgi:hypothetical protein